MMAGVPGVLRIAALLVLGLLQGACEEAPRRERKQPVQRERDLRAEVLSWG